MFDFIFKRSSSKTPRLPVTAAADASQQLAAAAALRRAEQIALARTLASNEIGAVDFILQSDFADARLIAAEHVHGQAMLAKVHQAMRNTDRRVARLMQERLDAIRFALSEQQRAETCIDTAQRLLLDQKLSPNQVGELDRQWQLIKAPESLCAQFDGIRAELGLRLDAQVALQRAVIDAVAQLQHLPDAAHGGADLEAALQTLARLTLEHGVHSSSFECASLPKNLLGSLAQALEQCTAQLAAQQQQQASLAARQALLAEWQGALPESLNAAQLKQAWQSLAPLAQGDVASDLQQQFDAILSGLASALPPPSKSASKPARVLASPELAALASEAGHHFMLALDALDVALQQGLLQEAFEHDKVLRESKGVKLSPAQTERLAQVRAEFKHLADWARWGGNVSREELIKAVEQLPLLGMSELAKKIGSLRERWKALDTTSGAAPKVLWEGFDAACAKAYAPVAAHFKQLSDERHANAARAQLLIDETHALSISPTHEIPDETPDETAADTKVGTELETEHETVQEAAPDWKSIAGAEQRLRQAWLRLGTIERKEKKRLDGAFSAALALLLAPLEQQRQIEMARREQLIVEVERLDPNQRNTLDTLRALQEKWQQYAQALPLERRIEQALWQRFRAACDALFAQRKEAASSADQARRDHLQAKEAVCVRLEIMVFQEPEMEPSAAACRSASSAVTSLLSDAKKDWAVIGPVPRASEQRIEQRYRTACVALQARIDTIAQHVNAAQAHALRDKLRLCQKLENSLVQDGAPDSDGAALWSALPVLPSRFEKALHGRFCAAQAALKQTGAIADDYAQQLEANRAILLVDVLRLELLGGIDSGAEFARARLMMQVEVLQSSLKSGDKAGTKAAQVLALCALPALADARTVSRVEQVLGRLGGVELK